MSTTTGDSTPSSGRDQVEFSRIHVVLRCRSNLSEVAVTLTGRRRRVAGRNSTRAVTAVGDWSDKDCTHYGELHIQRWDLPTVSEIEIIPAVLAGTGAADDPDWGFERDDELDEQYRRDLEEIDAAEKDAERTAATLRIC